MVPVRDENVKLVEVGCCKWAWYVAKVQLNVIKTGRPVDGAGSTALRDWRCSKRSWGTADVARGAVGAAVGGVAVAVVGEGVSALLMRRLWEMQLWQEMLLEIVREKRQGDRGAARKDGGREGAPLCKSRC